MLIYTSGSTGTPKGVMITFEAFTRASEGIAADVQRRVGSPDNRMLSYLPLAHSFERSWAEGASLVDGRMHLFFAESLDTFLQDLQRTQPTLFLSVPRLWLKFQQGVFAKMPPAKLDRLLAHSDPRQDRREEGAQGARPRPGEARGQRLGADPARI